MLSTLSHKQWKKSIISFYKDSKNFHKYFLSVKRHRLEYERLTSHREILYKKRNVSEQSTKVGRVSGKKTTYEDQKSPDGSTKAASQRMYKEISETQETTDSEEMKL